jgi:hypothetical protein
MLGDLRDRAAKNSDERAPIENLGGAWGVPHPSLLSIIKHLWAYLCSYVYCGTIIPSFARAWRSMKYSGHTNIAQHLGRMYGLPILIS